MLGLVFFLREAGGSEKGVRTGDGGGMRWETLWLFFLVCGSCELRRLGSW